MAKIVTQTGPIPSQIPCQIPTIGIRNPEFRAKTLPEGRAARSKRRSRSGHPRIPSADRPTRQRPRADPLFDILLFRPPPVIGMAVTPGCHKPPRASCPAFRHPSRRRSGNSYQLSDRPFRPLSLLIQSSLISHLSVGSPASAGPKCAKSRFRTLNPTSR